MKLDLQMRLLSGGDISRIEVLGGAVLHSRNLTIQSF